MKNKKIIFLAALVLSNRVFASEKLQKFEDLVKANNENSTALIEVLLRPYGQMLDFKITDESIISEECVDKTVIRARVTCNRKVKMKTQLHFAEGKGLLCKIDDNFSKIKCTLIEKL